MIFEARYPAAGWATVVVRAKDALEAATIAAAHGKTYLGDDANGVTVIPIEPEGEPGVLIEDWN